MIPKDVADKIEEIFNIINTNIHEAAYAVYKAIKEGYGPQLKDVKFQIEYRDGRPHICKETLGNITDMTTDHYTILTHIESFPDTKKMRVCDEFTASMIIIELIKNGLERGHGVKLLLREFIKLGVPLERFDEVYRAANNEAKFARDLKGMTLLKNSIIHDKMFLFDYLYLKEKEYSVERISDAGKASKTPLMIATIYGREYAINKLLKNPEECNINYTVGRKYSLKTALDFAHELSERECSAEVKIRIIKSLEEVYKPSPSSRRHDINLADASVAVTKKRGERQDISPKKNKSVRVTAPDGSQSLIEENAEERRFTFRFTLDPLNFSHVRLHSPCNNSYGTHLTSPTYTQITPPPVIPGYRMDPFGSTMYTPPMPSPVASGYRMDPFGSTMYAPPMPSPIASDYRMSPFGSTMYAPPMPSPIASNLPNRDQILMPALPVVATGSSDSCSNVSHCTFHPHLTKNRDLSKGLR